MRFPFNSTEQKKNKNRVLKILKHRVKKKQNEVQERKELYFLLLLSLFFN